jgi:hypothetical protein
MYLKETTSLLLGTLANCTDTYGLTLLPSQLKIIKFARKEQKQLNSYCMTTAIL